jgi:hypothetical protein
MAQLCGSSLYLPSVLNRLEIRKALPILPLLREGELEKHPWLVLLHPFSGLKDLYVGKGLTGTLYYALALQELTGQTVAEVLPTLQNHFIEDLESSGPIQEALGQLVAARQLSGLLEVVHNWDRQL